MQGRTEEQGELPLLFEMQVRVVDFSVIYSESEADSRTIVAIGYVERATAMFQAQAEL